jgi:hypothetical protein
LRGIRAVDGDLRLRAQTQADVVPEIQLCRSDSASNVRDNLSASRRRARRLRPMRCRTRVSGSQTRSFLQRICCLFTMIDVNQSLRPFLLH